MQSFLIIQTAFIGDVILATSLVEKLHQYYPAAGIDFLLRKGNEGVLDNHPFIREVLIWDKKQNKLTNLFKLIKKVRKNRYNAIINLQRFVSTGIITSFSGANYKIGFDKNPLSLFYTQKFSHELLGEHEVQRNHKLIESLTDKEVQKPKLYPLEKHFAKIRHYQNKPYVCIAPASIWYTKQFPKEQWIRLIQLLGEKGILIYLLGAASDFQWCEEIKNESACSSVQNTAGKLNLLESAALMQGASMNYVNDSAPMHLASAMNAPVTAVFCSTVPAFGFGPLSDNSQIIETRMKLSCRPCGLHGYKRCPRGDFKCASSIELNQFLLKE